MIVPGRGHLYAAPPDWPERLFSGSLNVKLDNLDRLFDNFSMRGRRRQTGLKWLDGDNFPPCFVIPYALITHNTLIPKWFKPRRGSAKLWRATLKSNNGTCHCWVMRRIGSHMSDTVELVSHQAIRKALSLTPDRNWPAELVLYPEQYPIPSRH